MDVRAMVVRNILKSDDLVCASYPYEVASRGRRVYGGLTRLPSSFLSATPTSLLLFTVMSPINNIRAIPTFIPQDSFSCPTSRTLGKARPARVFLHQGDIFDLDHTTFTFPARSPAISPDYESRPLSPVSDCSSDTSDELPPMSTFTKGFGRARHSVCLGRSGNELGQSSVVGFGRRQHFHRHSIAGPPAVAPSDFPRKTHAKRPLSVAQEHGDMKGRSDRPQMRMSLDLGRPIQTENVAQRPLSILGTALSTGGTSSGVPPRALLLPQYIQMASETAVAEESETEHPRSVTYRLRLKVLKLGLLFIEEMFETDENLTVDVLVDRFKNMPSVAVMPVLDAFKIKPFDLEPVYAAWTPGPTFTGDPKKDAPVDDWLQQVKEGCISHGVPQEYWHTCGQHFMGDKARARLTELKKVMAQVHGGQYRWNWKKFKVAMRNMSWDIDTSETETVKVRGSWWSRKTPKVDEAANPEAFVLCEEPMPMLGRSDTKLSEAGSSESRPTPSRSSTLSFWPIRKQSKDMSTDETLQRPTPRKVQSDDAVVSVSGSKRSNTLAMTSTNKDLPAVPKPGAEGKAPAWLLNATTALDFLSGEHPKVMSTISAILIVAGTIPSLPVITAGAGGAILASSTAHAVGAIAVGLGSWIKTQQEATASKSHSTA
ncbi:unnamed protein product [Mycena citricolor]|uniref:Uncharacterized protein n=1 Tax=Mycena citricolor TaxID=2018698 RepID=A0AAD2GYR5_9AGAR|nr:unnamed protein product [Mycena citricolor]